MAYLFVIKRLLLILLLINLTTPSFASRGTEDLKAKEAFLNLNLFTNGEGMHLAPGIIDLDLGRYLGPLAKHLRTRNEILQHRWGFNLVEGQIVGVFKERYKRLNVGVLGCVACHSSKAAGRFIIGLGNKNIDVKQVGKDVLKLQKIIRWLPHKGTREDFNKIRKASIRFANQLSFEEISNETQGLVPVSVIRKWFYDQLDAPYPKPFTKGLVKVPFLWGYGEKRKVGQFSDGFGNGILPGWAIAVELVGGQSPSTVRTYIDQVEDVEHLFSKLLPPKFPQDIKPINWKSAKQGKAVFQKNCKACHGTYSKDHLGLPIYKAPNWIPISTVNTDPERLLGNTKEFRDLVARNPLSDYIKATNISNGKGYFAPRLEGVWSRFPYLHNGSVPNIRALLTPPLKRPRAFSIFKSGEVESFDPVNLGLKAPLKGSAREIQLINLRRKKDSRYIYLTGPIGLAPMGQSNQGHPFGTRLSQSEKSHLIEFLKTL